MPGSITPLLRRANPAGRRPPRARARRAVLSAAMVLGFVGVTSATAAAEDAANSDGGAASADVSAADVAAGPNLGPVDPAWLRPPVPGPEVVLYEHGSFGGRAQGFAPGAYDATLGEFGALVNDEVSSLRVPAGRQAVLCEHVGADAGRCLWYPPGEYSFVWGFNDLASVLFVAAPANGPGATVYSGRHQGGSSVTVNASSLATAGGLGALGNDTASSLDVWLGRSALLCEDSPGVPGVALGRCWRFGAGRHEVDESFHDRTSFIAVGKLPTGPAQLHQLDSVRLNDVLLAGSHNTYCRPDDPTCSKNGTEEQPDPVDPGNRWKFDYLWEGLNYAQTVEIDVWTTQRHWTVNHGQAPAPAWEVNNNNCPDHGFPGYERDQDLRACIEALRHWHLAYPQHPLTIVKIEMKDGFRNGYSPSDLDELVTNYRSNGVKGRIQPDWVFKPADLKTCRLAACGGRSYANLDDAARAGNWPTMGELRGKFLFVVVRGTYKADGPRQYARSLQDGGARMMFPSTLVKTAHRGGPDPRDSYYEDPNVAKWAVFFDMEVGRVTGGKVDIEADYVRGLDRAGYVVAGTISDPTTFRFTLPTAAPPLGTTDYGNYVVKRARDEFSYNVIDTDREKLRLTYPGLNG